MVTPQNFGSSFFKGLKPGDRWCVCANALKLAHENDAACKVILDATNEKTLELIPIEVLQKHAENDFGSELWNL